MNEDLIIQNIQKLLSNIENLTKEEENKLKDYIMPYYSLETSDKYMDLYNKLNESQLKKLIEIIGIDRITNDFVSKINNLEYLVFPYDENNYRYTFLIKDNPKLATIVYKSPVFYKNFKNPFNIDSYINVEIEDEELAKLFANNAIKYIPNIENFNFKYELESLLKHLDDETLISLIKKKKGSDSIVALYQKLSDEEKRKIIKEEWFLSKIDINDVITNMDIIIESPDDVIVDLIGENYAFWKLVDLYHESLEFRKKRKTIFLRLAIEKFDLEKLDKDKRLKERYYNFLFLASNQLLDELGEYKEKIIDHIEELDDKSFVEYYFNMYLEGENLSTIRHILDTMVKDRLQDNNIIINSLSPQVIKSDNKELLDLVIQHITKEDLLLLSIRNTYINNYVLNILKSNPGYFKGIYIENINKFPMKSNSTNINNFLNISIYLSEEQYNIYFIKEYIQKNDNVKKTYIEFVKKDPNQLSSIKDLSLFELEDVEKIINKIDINKLMYLIMKKDINISKNKKLLLLVNEQLSKRIDEIFHYINNEDNRFDVIINSGYERIFLLLSNKCKERLINSSEDLSFLTDFFNICRDKYTSELLYNRLLKIYTIADIDELTLPPIFRDESQEKEFYDKLDISTIIEIALHEFRGNDINCERCIKFKEMIHNKLKDDITIIFTPDVFYYLDELIFYLDKEYQENIKNTINLHFNRIDKYNEIKCNLENYSSKANFVYSLKNGYINDINYQFVRNMHLHNKFLFETMNFRMLDRDLLNMGNYFINKVSRHSNMSKKILKLYDTDINKYNLLVLLSNEIIKQNNMSIYDEKIEIIINYLIVNGINIPTNIDNNVLTDIENYILEQSINKKILPKNVDYTNFQSINDELLNEQISKCDELDKLKYLIIKKYFGLEKQVITDFLFSYAYNWNSVREFADNHNIVDNYIKSINNIININDINILKEVSSNLNKYTITDYMNIKNIMIKAYNKSIEIDIKDKQNGPTRNITIDNKNIEVTELIDNYGIFIHSTDAYGFMTLINNDYYESWNYNPNTKNHGICTSYITNSSYGSAPVNNKGVMFGFSNIDNTSIPLIAPYDSMTKNDGFTITSRRKPFYCRLNTLSDYTRHTHNETSLERFVFKDNNSYLRQPDSIIIFEDMNEEIKKNSIKAYEDFKKHGVELKLIYIDRTKVAKNEADKLHKMIELYESNYDLNILREILNKYHSNICGCTFIDTKDNKIIDENILFKTSYIKDLLYKTINYIENTNNVELLNEFIYIIQEEEFKFNLIKEDSANRKKTTLLLDENLKQRIRNIQINENNIKAKK